MTATPPLTPTNPIVVNKVYDKYWVQNISIGAPSPLGDASASLLMIPYILSTGELAPDTMAFTMVIPNIFARIAAKDGELKQIMAMILDYASKEAKAQGKIQ